MLEKLGPTFVKLGQALSIRPDVIGPAATEELAKLQDAGTLRKGGWVDGFVFLSFSLSFLYIHPSTHPPTHPPQSVPPFSNEVAFSILEQELGKPWQEVFSEISSEPIAAASLAQVYKAKLKENDEWVAVKIQRPEMLETGKSFFSLSAHPPTHPYSPAAHSNRLFLLYPPSHP